MKRRTSATGTASSGIRVARKPWRKTKTTMTTRASASTSVLTISRIRRSRPGSCRATSHSRVGREPRLDLVHQLRRALHGVDALEPGSW